MMKNAKYADFTVVKQMEVSSGVSIRQDIAEWLSSRKQQREDFHQGGEYNNHRTVTYNVQLTSLGISARTSPGGRRSPETSTSR